MINLRQSLNKRNVRLAILLVFIQIYLILGHIVPAFEKTPYYQAKITTLNQRLATLEMTKEHVSYYQIRSPKTQGALKTYHQQVKQDSDTTGLLHSLNEFSQLSGLELKEQTSSTSRPYPDIIIISISQSLVGPYQAVSSYLDKAESLSPFLVITKCELHNPSPFSVDPALSLNLNISLYLPIL